MKKIFSNFDKLQTYSTTFNKGGIYTYFLITQNHYNKGVFGMKGIKKLYGLLIKIKGSGKKGKKYYRSNKEQAEWFENSEERISKKIGRGIKIKTQLLIGGIVPIMFVILVGFLSYYEASKGFEKNAEDTTERNLEMSMSYLDFGFSLASSDMFELLLSDELNQYISGQLDYDFKEKKDVYTKLKHSLVVKANSNSFIETITIVPKSNSDIIASSDFTGPGFYEEWSTSKEAELLFKEGFKTRWIGSHKQLDQKSKRYASPYAVTLIGVTNNKCAAVFLDISKEKMQEVLQKMCVDQGSISMYITNDGNIVAVNGKGLEQREIYVDLLGQDFIRSTLESNDTINNQYVDFRGSTYYYAYEKIQSTGSLLATLVKKDTILEKSNAIKKTSIITILIATVIACMIASYTLKNITTSMKRITNSLKKTSEGDLTVELLMSSENEFGVISKGIMHTLHNTRKLIGDVDMVVNRVSTESEEITLITNSVTEYACNINDVIKEIDMGVAQQAEDTQSCLSRMEDLSKQIEIISTEAEKINQSSKVSFASVIQGMEVVQQLRQHAGETTQSTNEVKNNVMELEQSLNQIEKFVQIINGLAEETNLLSLNASIEAARAGEAGRGFSVVAESIRRLADGSLHEANTIREIIKSLKRQAKDTIRTASTAEQVVQSQTEVVGITAVVFNKIKNEVDAMNSNIEDIVNSIEKVNVERIAMMNMVESISTVSEETAACTSTVKQTVEDEVKLMKDLRDLIAQQNESMNQLQKSVHVFKI